MKLEPLASPAERMTYENHCDNIAAILATTVFLWRARRRIRVYLETTGAAE